MAVAVTRRDYPELRDRPFVVAGPSAMLTLSDWTPGQGTDAGRAPQRRGAPDQSFIAVHAGSLEWDERRAVVLGASAPVRAQGVRDGMDVATASRLCPEAAIVSAPVARYRHVAAELWNLYTNLTPLVEPVRLDEAVLDMRGCERLWNATPQRMGLRLRDRVARVTGLIMTCGLAATRSAAQVAASLAAPGTLYPVEAGQEPAFLAALDLRYLPGLDDALAAELRVLGLHTIGQFAALPAGAVARRFGAAAVVLHRLANGIDDRPVVPPSPMPAIRRTRNFADDATASGCPTPLLVGGVRTLAIEISAALAAQHLSGRTVKVTILIAAPDTRATATPCSSLGVPTAGGSRTRHVTLKEHTRSELVLAERAAALLDSLLAEKSLRRAAAGCGPGHLPVLEIALEVGDLAPEIAYQAPLFTQVPARSLTGTGVVAAERRRRLDGARAALRRRYGPGVLCHMVPIPYAALPDQHYRVIPLDEDEDT
jgi:DNA polymerase-4